MKVHSEISVWLDASLAPLGQQLQTLYPSEHFGPLMYTVEILEDDPRLNQILQLLEQHGLRPWAGIGERRPGRDYWRRRTREYDHADLEAAPLVEMCVLDRGAYGYRDDAGRLFLPVWLTRSRQGRFCFSDGCPCCGEETKAFIERQRFEPVLFQEALVVSGKDVADNRVLPDAPPWWEMTSDLTMPPVSQFLKKSRPKKGPVGRFHEGLVLLREEGFVDRELHYLRSELDELGEFDAARLYEQLQGQDNRPLVCSQRFYRFCRDHDLHDRWRPVRIDEG